MSLASIGPGPADATERMLVALSRLRPEPCPAPEAFTGVDAGRLIGAAARLGNFCLIARRLLAAWPAVDPELKGRIERNLNHAEVRERLGLADLAALASALTRGGEPLLLLKGAAYSPFIYPERGLRSFVDLDVLVRPRAVGAAVAALERLGYRTVHAIQGSVDLQRRLGNSGPTLTVELHTELVHHHEYPWYRAQLALDEERLFERSERRALHGAETRVLAAPDELVYSVVHFFFHHDLAGLKYHSDLNALLSDPVRRLESGAAIDAARAARAGLAVGLALLVHERLFGRGSVPPELLEALRPRGPRLKLLERVLPPLERIPLSPGRVAGHPAKALVAPGLKGPLTLGLRWLFPGRRFLMSFYGLERDAWRGGYHLRYPAAILRKGLRRGIFGLHSPEA